MDVHGQFVAYTDKLLEAASSYRDRVGERDIVVTKNPDGSVSATDPDSGEVFVAIRLFWFDWYAFHPDTELRTEPL